MKSLKDIDYIRFQAIINERWNIKKVLKKIKIFYLKFKFHESNKGKGILKNISF